MDVMRKARPNFIVEYKGGRRQKPAPSKSIWGALDFASLRAESKTDFPPEISTEPAIAVEGDDRLPADHKGPDKHRVDLDLPVDARPTRWKADSLSQRVDDGGDTISPLREVRSDLETVPMLQSEGHDHQRDAQSEQKENQQARVSQSGDIDALPLPSRSISRQQLAELDAENAELKELLRERLTTENHRLVNMLERFITG